MNINVHNYLSFGKTTNWFRAKDNKTAINNILNGIQNIELTINQEVDVMIEGKVSKELLDGVKKRICQLRKTRELLYKRLEKLQKEDTSKMQLQKQAALNENKDIPKNILTYNTIIKHQGTDKNNKNVSSSPKNKTDNKNSLQQKK